MEADRTDITSLQVSGLGKRYGSVTALGRVDLSVRRGEFLTILGPSGSGKTTLLKVIAGFEFADTGAVTLERRDITFARPADRGIGMVFQNYALFPHMTASENVAFPLRMRRMPPAERERRVSEALEMVALADLGSRLPTQLSGGQQQRVALARAVVFNPPLLLLDEPFGALDRRLREQMQLEVKRLQRRLGLTAVLVTHDQEEALLLSDRIAVMSHGALQQLADPETIYQFPCNRFVADFIGESNLYAGRVTAVAGSVSTIRLEKGGELRAAAGIHGAGAPVHAVIRPESLRLADASAENAFTVDVVEAVFTGGGRKFRLRTPEGMEFLMRLPPEATGSRLNPGDRVTIAVPPEAIHLVV